MAEVWKAELHGAESFRRALVIKRILPHLGSDTEFVKMFTAEALLSARLEHPNIVQVFEFSQVEGEYFIAMEYVPGMNLSAVISHAAATEAIPIGLCAFVVREISLALAYAHELTDEKGPLCIIHRDVSPSNIMITTSGNVKLLDFGIAKALGRALEKTRSGVFKGKLGYISPELVDAEGEIDHRSDLFAAGIVLHEMLTGRRLFRGRDEMQTLAMIRACKIPPPSTLREEVPPELDRICMKALARDPADRYLSGNQLAADLSSVLNPLGWSMATTAAYLRDHDLKPHTKPVPSTLDTPRARRTPDPPERKRRWTWAAAIGLAGMITVAGALKATRMKPEPTLVAEAKDAGTATPEKTAATPEPKTAVVEAAPAVESNPVPVEQAAIRGTRTKKRPAGHHTRQSRPAAGEVGQLFEKL
jgi:serine/threonine protein kinase